MLIVVALGGNALLRRGEPMTAEAQRANVRRAARALATVAPLHRLVITHGNGPQVGLLAAQSAAASSGGGYPLDVLGAETEGMIGYLIEQELRNQLSADVELATLLTLVEVDPRDPAFLHPEKFVGPGYDRPQADRLAAERGWTFRIDGSRWRRVVPSPAPLRILQLRPIEWLLARGAIVICAGGGGIPVAPAEATGRGLVGVEAVIDKDASSELLARQLGADLLVMLTDVDAVYADWDGARRQAIHRSTPAALAQRPFAAGSMGPKVEAACRFVTLTGRHAAIGTLDDLPAIVRGDAGTVVAPDVG